MPIDDLSRVIATLDNLSSEPGPPVRVELPNTVGWLVRSHDDVRTVLSDDRFSADDQKPGFPFLFNIPNPPGGLSFLRMDPPRHDVLRRVLTPSFTVRRIEAMRPAITRASQDLLDRMRSDGPPTDLVEAFALPLPSQVICILLGVPYDDRDTFQHHTRNVVSLESYPADAADSYREIGEYLHRLATAKREHPGDDMLSHIGRQRDAVGMDDADVVAMARLMLTAGHETTANMIGMMMLLLFNEPQRMRQLRGDPSLVRPAVEESLRRASIVRSALTRVAVADAQVGGVTIRAGEGVVLGLNGANHDPAWYDRPEEFDFQRDARTHVAFGFGVHQCLGQALARLELQIAVTGLLHTFENLAPAVPLDEITMKNWSLIMGPQSLPVTW
ncbi:cytochrome P450 [Haloactinospora alba]|uniref:Cytochrome P450 n=1 Tax=Haloactinospora alba TaxID=405555 RepID=A0A543NP94_9ACTN|nr:cytochrome P450 [Haloactinospora alba]TQN33567.1 cytochrome P450 [Haloactinospora alba]